MININKIIADNWIRTADPWYWKQPLHQLSHTTTAQMLSKGFVKMHWEIDSECCFPVPYHYMAPVTE